MSTARAHLSNAYARGSSWNKEWTDEQWLLTRQAFKFMCAYCGLKEGTRGEKLTLDHWIPVSKGGRTEAANAVVSCKKCNSAKGNRMPWNFCGALKYQRILSALDALSKGEATKNIQQLMQAGERCHNNPRKGKVTHMKLGEMFPSQWLKAEDINGAEQFVIENVTQQQIEKDGGMKTENVMHFRGTEKKMTLNRTNAEAIAMMHGDDTDLWIGKVITLYVTPVQGPRGLTQGIRVDTRPPAPVAYPQVPLQAQQQPQQQPLSSAMKNKCTDLANQVWGEQDAPQQIGALKARLGFGKWSEMTEDEGGRLLHELGQVQRPVAVGDYPEDEDDSDPFADQ